MRIEETIINIVFDAAKGTVPVGSREGVVGQCFGALPKPRRAGYTFAGWYLGDEEVTEETVIASERDVRLVARWEKKARGERRRTMLRRQRAVAVALAVAIVVLSIALAVANRLVGVYSLKDTFVNENGVEQTVKYKIKKEKGTGLYALYNQKGEKMAVVEDNGFNNYTSSSDGVQYLVYETDVSGNQYRINTATGEYEIYAVVDTEGDEVLGGTVINTRVMMYPRIKQAETYSVKVTNAYGTYTVYRKTVGNSAQGATTPYTSEVVVATNGVDSLATYNPELYASLCVSCGYSLTMQKLDLTDPAAPRLPDGSVNYATYGLAIVTDDHGDVDYTKSPAVFTITKGAAAADGSFNPTETTYTVYVGDAIVSGGGYYVKRADRDAVYIVSSDISTTVLRPVEAIVTPQVVYPMKSVTYPMVENFSLREADYDSDTGDFSTTRLITEFSYVDLAKRENTLYSSTPYSIPEGSTTQLLKGYALNSDSVNEVLMNLYSMQFLSCVKLCPSTEDLRHYGLDGAVWVLSYFYDPEVANGGSGSFVPNIIIIGQKTADATLGQDVYYIYSVLYDMIVAVDPYYCSFLDWEQSHWYANYFFQNNIATVREMHYTIGGKQYDFYLDNSATEQQNGVSSTNLRVVCPQYTGNADHVLDYTIEVDEPTDTGTTKRKTYTALDNFRRFYSRLLWYTIEGDVNAAEFKASTGMTVDEWIASDTNDDKAIAKISYRVEDYAATANTATDAAGNKLYTENNKFDAVIRLYEYGRGRKLLLTIEIADSYAADGTPIFNATHAQGNFYVSAVPLANVGGSNPPEDGGIAKVVEDLLNGVLIESMT